MDFEDQPLFSHNEPSTILPGGAQDNHNNINILNTTPNTYSLPIDDFYQARNNQHLHENDDTTILSSATQNSNRNQQPNIIDLMVMITQNERLAPDILPYPSDAISKAVEAIKRCKSVVSALSQLHQVRLDSCSSVSHTSIRGGVDNNNTGDMTRGSNIIDFASLIEEDQIVQQALASASQGSPNSQQSDLVLPYSKAFLDVSEKDGKGGLREGFIGAGDLISVSGGAPSSLFPLVRDSGLTKNNRYNKNNINNAGDVDRADKAHLMIGVVADSDVLLGKPLSSSTSYTVDNTINSVGALSSIGAGVTSDALLLPFQPHDILRFECTRIEFLLSELLRVRLHKIQALCQRLYHYKSNNNNNNDDQYSSISSSAGSERLSSKEVAMVEKLCELYEEALRQSPGLQAITHHHDQQEGEHHNGKYLLPGGFFSGYRVGARDGQLSTPPQLLVGSKDDVILPEPFQRKRVFVRVLEDLGNFEFGNAGGVSGVSKALYGGDVVMAPFYLFEDYVAKHKVRLL
eukprot:Tbor_TRINITY_DN4892_c2_g2::TRINITY_DN4892_c2_g2_i7::g.1393::m.1393